jgi:hypothetical protein
MSDSDDEVIIASSSKANSGINYDIKIMTVSTVKGKKGKATNQLASSLLRSAARPTPSPFSLAPKPQQNRGKGNGRSQRKQAASITSTGSLWTSVGMRDA